MSDTETVLLMAPDGKEPFIAEVPAGATRHRVPNRDGIDPDIRGGTYDRTGYLDGAFMMPLFRRRSRQL